MPVENVCPVAYVLSVEDQKERLKGNEASKGKERFEDTYEVSEGHASPVFRAVHLLFGEF